MSYSLYFHIPFCIHRCAYCDFNTYAGQESFIPGYVDALVREIGVVANSVPERLPVHSLFFGGGTPSLLEPSHFEKILQVVEAGFDLHIPASGEVEISSEANPGTVSLASLTEMRYLGFNRLSFGVQSTHPQELRQLERIHDFFEVIESVRWARQAGFGNLNLDLIYGLPEQSLARWQESLRRAVDLKPEHLSLYALTVEAGTPFGRWASRGLMPMPDPDLAADMYEWATEYLAGADFEQYEISNWSKAGFQCCHNLQYWRNQPYLGFGAGAHGYAYGVRYSNILRIKPYIERVGKPANLYKFEFPLSPATISHQPITKVVEMQETMITGLRLTDEGISANAFRDRFGVGVEDVFGKEIQASIGQGLLEWAEVRNGADQSPVLRLTTHGRLLGNQVFMRFVG
jgi:oxygen-independent coproporphyrinogen III oxidase